MGPCLPSQRARDFVRNVGINSAGALKDAIRTKLKVSDGVFFF